MAPDCPRLVHARGCSPGIPSAAASHAFPIFNSAAMIFGFWIFFFLFFPSSFCSDKSVMSPVPYKMHWSDLPLQKVNDREFYLALEMGTFKKRFLLLYLFSFLMAGGRARTVLKGFFNISLSHAPSPWAC